MKWVAESLPPAARRSAWRRARARTTGLLEASGAAAKHSGTALEWIKAVAMPLATVAVTVVGGGYFTALVKDRETRETNAREYAQLLTQREQSDALIRKDMFQVAISNFMAAAGKSGWNDGILYLELLASNFNQSLDLAPLFKDAARRIPTAAGISPADREALQSRLDMTATALNLKQVNSLERRGFASKRTVAVGRWETLERKAFIDTSIRTASLVPSTQEAPISESDMMHFQLEIIGVTLDRREIEVRMVIDFSDEPARRIDRTMWVGRYDFPMLNNTQIPHGLRASVVVSEFVVPAAKVERASNSHATVHLVVFPAASASFKERQDFDDILLDMMRSQRGAAPALGVSR